MGVGGRMAAEPASGVTTPLAWRTAGWVLVPTVAPVVVGLVAPSSRPVQVAAIIVAVGLATLSFARLRALPVALFAAILTWLTIERLAVGAMSPRLDGNLLGALLAYKEAFFPVLALLLLPRVATVWARSPRDLRVLDALAIGFCLLVTLSALASGADLFDRLVNGRRLIQLPLIYLCVRLLSWDVESVRGLVLTVIVAAVAVSLFGLLEVSVAESLVWREAVPAAYFYHLSSEAGLSATGTDVPIAGLPVIFYDFTTGEPHRRLVATFLEPTTVASFLALGTALAAAWRPVRPMTLGAAIVIGAAVGLTLSKAGWAIVALAVGYVIVVSFVPRLRDPGWLISMTVTLICGLIVVAVLLEQAGAAPGPLAHFQGLQEGIASALRDPLGLGVGFGGNFGGSKIGAESTFGVTLVQVGWLGLVLWCGWLLALIVVTAIESSHVRGLAVIGLGLGAALCGYLGTAALTESAGGLLGNWLYAWIAAAVVTAAAGRRGEPAPHPVQSEATVPRAAVDGTAGVAGP